MNPGEHVELKCCVCGTTKGVPWYSKMGEFGSVTTWCHRHVPDEVKRTANSGGG